MANENKMMTGKFRVSYPNVLKPQRKDNPTDKDKYSISMLFSKQLLKDDPQEMALFKRLTAEIKRVGSAAFPDGECKRIQPMQDGDTHPKKKDIEAYQGHYFCDASTMFLPECFDNNRQDILSEKEFYPGCYARARVHVYSWSNNGGGVSVGFDAVQKLSDGEALGDGGSAKDDFEDDYAGGGSSATETAEAGSDADDLLL
jgi:hypothetical protein